MNAMTKQLEKGFRATGTRYRMPWPLKKKGKRLEAI
jgi:hypothetical protein